MESKCILYFSSRLRHDSIIYNKTAVFGKKSGYLPREEHHGLFVWQIPRSSTSCRRRVLYIVGCPPSFCASPGGGVWRLGISKEKLSAVARSSAVFTIVPSVSIVIGLFTLSTVLGIPWPWYRLSVVGSVSYELMAADMVADGMGYGSVGEMAAQADHTVFGAVMFVMSICILAGIIINIFAVEKIQTGMSTLKKKRGDWGTIVNSCFFLGIVAAFTPLVFASGTVYALTFLISMGVAALCALCMRRFHLKWLGSFIMSISLIVSMAASVLLEQIF